MAFTIPNEADAFNGEQAELDKVDFDILAANYNSDGVVSYLGATPGCAVTQRGAGANMSVDVSAGYVRVGGYYAWVAATNVAITAADATNPRFDMISVNYNGTLTATAGTAAAEPVFPAIPANNLCLAIVYVPANDTTIETNQCIDKRVIVSDRFQYADEFTAGSSETGEVGELGWQFTSNGTAAITPQAGTSGHPGVCRIGSGGTNGNDTRLHLGNAVTSGIVIPTDVARIRWICSIPTITTYSVKLGLLQDVSNVTQGQSGTAGAWFEHFPASDASWRCYCRQASTSSTVLDTAVDVTAGNWYVLEMNRIQSGNWQFAVNGAFKNVISSNQPTTACNIGLVVETLTTGARTIDIDFMGVDFIPLGNRYT